MFLEIFSPRDVEAGLVAGWDRRQCSVTAEGLPWAGGSDHSLLLLHNHWVAVDTDCILVLVVVCCYTAVVVVDIGVAASVAAVVAFVAVATIVVASVAAVVASSFVVASHVVVVAGRVVAVVVDDIAVVAAAEEGWHKVAAHCQCSLTCCWSG